MSNNPIFLPILHKLQAVVNIGHLNFIESLHVNTIVFVLVDEHFFICFFLVIFEQIHHVFVVKLKEGAVYFNKFSAFGDDVVENVVDGPWNDSSMILILF